jgi:N-methylhydantoinase B/oxoprolinase/acetone carboxylase alpha subunit
VVRANGRREALSFVASRDMHPGVVFVIETPGGGYGKAEESEPVTMLRLEFNSLAATHS